MKLTNLGFFNWILYIDLLTISVVISIYFYITHSRVVGISGEAYNKVSYAIIGDSIIGYIPLSTSFFGAYFSSVTILGIPNEIYLYGMTIMFMSVAFAIANVVSIIFFAPVFYELRLLSVYEYLAFRFSRLSQVMCALIFIFQMLLYLGIVLYGPALAFSSVVDVNKWIIVLTVAIVSVIYTTLGSFVASVYTSLFHVFLIFVGLIPILIKGSNNAGGFYKIFQHAKNYGSLYIDGSFDLRDRCTVPGVIIGGSFMWMGMVCVTQQTVQRINASKTQTHAKMVVILSILQFWLLLIFTGLCGLIIGFRFSDVDSTDVLLVRFVLEELQNYPGMLGLFLVCIMSGSLCTLSAGLNSMAAVTLIDIIPIIRSGIEDRSGYASINLFTTIYGFIIVWFAYLSSLSDNVIQLSYAIFGTVSGPILGVFTLGIFLPMINKTGALIGHIVSQLFLLFILMGKMVSGIKYPALTHLYLFNTTYVQSRIIYNKYRNPITGIENLYAISFYWYSLIGFLITIIVGCLASYVTRNAITIIPQKQLITPLLRNYWKNYLENDETNTSTNYEIVTINENHLEIVTNS